MGIIREPPSKDCCNSYMIMHVKLLVQCLAIRTHCIKRKLLFFMMLLHSLRFARSEQARTGKPTRFLDSRMEDWLSAPRGQQYKEKSPWHAYPWSDPGCAPLRPVRGLPSCGPGDPQCTAAQSCSASLRPARGAGMKCLLGRQDSGELESRATATLSCPLLFVD